MKQKIFLFASAFILVAVGFYSCQKSNKEVSVNNEEVLLYVDNSQVRPSNPVLGGNIEKVTAIRSNNSLLSILKLSPEWQKLTAQNTILENDIKRSYLYSGEVSLVTIQINPKSESTEYLNIYMHGEKFLITKLYETKNANGLTNYKVLSATDELYYQFDLNEKRQIGNWTFVKDLPKIFDKPLATANREIEAVKGGCSSKPFYECMNCLIVGVCGSDWVCTIACGLAIPSCLGGAAAVCIFVS